MNEITSTAPLKSTEKPSFVIFPGMLGEMAKQAGSKNM